MKIINFLLEFCYLNITDGKGLEFQTKTSKIFVEKKRVGALGNRKTPHRAGSYLN